MKTALICINGNLADSSSVKKYIDRVDIIICADGGVGYALTEGLVPDVVIGDMDSISPDTRTSLEKEQVAFITYPREKDFTDTQLAIQYAIDHQATHLIICGTLGDRIDHMMANIHYMATIAHEVQLMIIEGNQEISFVSDAIELQGAVDDELSLIPLHKDAHGITTKGLQYPLHNATLQVGSTRGISNVFKERTIAVSLKEGMLMVVHRRVL